jgi:hypothetical protein
MPFTNALLHYQLVTNPKVATTWYWFFNVNNLNVFSRAELVEQLIEWVEQTETKKISPSSLKKDVDCLLQLYVPKKDQIQDPEEVVRSPLQQLGLITESFRDYFVRGSASVTELGLDTFYIVLLMYRDTHHIDTISIDEMLQAKCMFGNVFNLKRNEIVDIIDQLAKRNYGVKFVRTNRLDSVLIPDTKPYQHMRKVYEAWGRKGI